MFDHNEPAHLEAVLRAAIAEGQPRTGRPWKKIVSLGSRSRGGAGGVERRGCCAQGGVRLPWEKTVRLGTCSKEGQWGGFSAPIQAMNAEPAPFNSAWLP